MRIKPLLSTGVPLLVIYLITLGFRVYWLTQKEGLMVDEATSVQLACYNDFEYPLNTELSGQVIKETSLCDNASLKNMLGDIKRLWVDNRDPNHTNFYYSLLRLFLGGLKTGDLKPIILRGGILNLIIFTVSFFAFYLLMRFLFNNKFLSLAAAFCAMISTVAISNTLNLRPYQLQEAFFTIFVLCFLKTLDKQKAAVINNKYFVDAALVCKMSFIASLTLLTGYYSLVFIGLFGIYVIFHNNRTHKKAESFAYIAIFILSILFSQVFYSKYMIGFIGSQAQITPATLFSGGIVLNILKSFQAVGVLLYTQWFNLPVIITMALITAYLLLVERKIVFQRNVLLVFAAALVFMVITMILAPWKIIRYAVPVFPFFILLPFMLLANIRNKIFRAIGTAALCCIFAINAFDAGKIENLYRGKPASYLFTRNSDIPVVVVSDEKWKLADMVPYFNDNQRYVFCELPDLKKYFERYESAYYVIETPLLNPLNDSADYLKSHSKSNYKIGYYTCFFVEPKERQ